MKLKDQVNFYLQKIIENIIGEKAEIEIQPVQESIHGDYSTNIALVVYPKLKNKFESPMELASYLCEKLGKSLQKEKIEKIEVSAPGFINFWLKDTALLKNLGEVIDYKDNYGKGESLKNKKIMLEFADPNPFKEFHIGHLRNITLGESYARLLEFQVANVWRVNYQGDVGMHVAKALYGVLSSEFGVRSLEKKSAGERAKFLGEAYADGAKAYEESEKAKKEIQEINKKLYKKDSVILAIWEKGRQWSLDHFEEMYGRLGTKYKRYYFESEVAEKGREIVLSHIKDGIFERHAGAVVFRGAHTRVFVTSENYATYEAKDLALAKIKSQDFQYDQSIIITANEQNSYFKVVLAALGKVFPDLALKTVHESFGFVNLKDGKMSSRSGSVVTGEWLLDEAKRKIKENFSAKGGPASGRKDMDVKTLEKVAVGAVKYSMLKFSRKSDITFSFEESISLEGNSGPYIQYSFARTQSVLARIQNSEFRIQNSESVKLEKEELLILRLLVHFPEIVEEAGGNFAPNLLCNYLFELSQAFNNFYQKHKIIGSENEDFRLSLTSAVGQILKTGLFLLGIEAPSKM
ncbi:MAG: arginine--tRNA ligase [Candidatus Levybacteria bacterium RIFCSPLOWO2_02_FULL_37_10]|nr:MAG: arginine--tRNA ligase [Candidatus Levybacteria bacterium RIFCSPHIGHO2_01_FULL_37_33]OGH16243.1 MAG: arginine--tRNA ligase [Candidatus Levybacteria bacterium RIFCSPHIGHO2_02_FULL_37_11]OGH43613.1 MAG: arginine--tRNA ligase [Candidatus Levybacteria bacterium RIFCSPLOWO2_02_FULL_37_10]